MKKFVLFLTKIVVLLIAVAVVLDVVYTIVYVNSNCRSKIDYLYNSSDEEYDVIFLGSSRVNNHFVPELFEKEGYKTFNFGITRSRLEESALQLKMMIERRYKIKNIILQVDLNINTNDHSEAIRSLFMPYLHQSKTIRNHYKNIPEYNKLLLIPFYRYMNYDARIGFREMYYSATAKKTNVLENKGFNPLANKPGKMIPADLSKYYPKKNVAYEEIKQLCKKNNINLIAITTPICTSTINRDYFNHIQKIYPEIMRYENAVTADRYFSTCGHLNKKGAEKFTRVILTDFKKHQFNN
jgi:hypothetical protein